MFKKVMLTGFLVLVLAAGVFSPVRAQEVVPVDPINPPEVTQLDGIIDETPEYYFVELSGKALVDGGGKLALKAEKNAFRNAAKRAGIQYTERMAFDSLWNGVSVKIDPTQLSALMRLPGVKAVYPVDQIFIPETFAGDYDPELYTALAMTGADIAQSELGYTGAGIKVAVMDTGIDYDHPDLGGCFGPGCRVAMGWDFVGDSYNANPTDPATYQPVPHPDADPDDCNGHGTHVSGIIGANGAVVGVAPGVTFGAYRVFGCDGSTESDIMLAAMEMAFADKMDVLNMSIGSAYNWPQYPTAVAASKMVDRGMVVVASIGNEGANGLYAAGAPGLGEKVIGVASYDNTVSRQFAFAVSPDGKLIGYNAADGGPVPQTGTEDIVAASPINGCSVNGVSPFAADAFAGKLVLIQRGTCTFYEKALNAQNAGATGMILFNNQAGQLNPTVAGAVPITIPVAAITLADGQLIATRIAAGTTSITWTNQTVQAPVATGGLISSFSSYGLSPDLALKPDIGAPGGNIWSTYPLELGGYASMGGTSMSSPHVAGAAALLLQAKPYLQAVEVRGVLQNSADPKLWSLAPGYGLLDLVHRQGAGMLDIDDAILATTTITPAKISAGEGEAGPYTETLHIKNTSSMSVTYDLTYVNAISTGKSDDYDGVINPDFYLADDWVSFSSDSVVVPPFGAANVKATIYPATGPEYGIYGGYIVLNPQGGGQVYRVPYAGYVGDYQDIQVLAPTKYEFPWLAFVYDGSYYGPLEDYDWDFTMVDGDMPYVLAHFDHQAELVKFEVFDKTLKKNYKTFAVEEYMIRNSTLTGFYAWVFDGYTFAGNKSFMVPDGDYVIKMSVLKANGKANVAEDWETWVSPIFKIDRP